ncbi:hypothetical protein Dimus_016272 [Dionaea muscipula]
MESVNTSKKCGKSQECDSKIWEERHFKLHGSDIYGSPNGKEVGQSATSDDETHELLIKKGEEPKKYDFFEDTFLTMCKLTMENGIWWIGSGENRRRDDDVNAPEEEAGEEEEEQQTGFDWEAVIDEAAIVEGESGSGEKFYDAEEEAQGSPDLHDEIPAEVPPSSTSQKDKGTTESTLGSYRAEVEFLKFQASLKEKGQTNFMMIWRRPKQRMSDF